MRNPKEDLKRMSKLRQNLKIKGGWVDKPSRHCEKSERRFEKDV